MDLTKILQQHALWLRTDGREGARADLRGADLIEADLREANLRGANLSGADLRDADLAVVNLRGADLRRANLSEACLRDADLGHANLSGSNLSGSYLRGACLYRANLRGADLSEADLNRADLEGSNLSGADLRGANLRRTDLRDADLSGAIGLPIVADAHARLKAVAMAALTDADALNMNTWHTCQTAHCIAGWAIHQAGELGRTLEAIHGPDLAGRLLLGHEAALHFYDDDDAAKAWLQSVLDAPDVE